VLKHTADFDVRNPTARGEELNAHLTEVAKGKRLFLRLWLMLRLKVAALFALDLGLVHDALHKRSQDNVTVMVIKL